MKYGVSVAERIFTEVDVIGVTPANGAEPSVHILRYLTAAVYGDVGRQHRVNLVEKIRNKRQRCFKMRVKVSRMHAGIRAPAARDAAVVGHKDRKRLLEGLLNCANFGLYLPAAIMRSVKSKVEKITRQSVRNFGKSKAKA